MTAVLTLLAASLPLTLLAAVAMRTRRGAPPGERHAIATATFLALLVLPALHHAPLPGSDLGANPVRDALSVARQRALSAMALAPAHGAAQEARPADADAGALRPVGGRPTSRWLGRGVVLVWVVGASILLFRLALGHIWAGRLARGRGAERPGFEGEAWGEPAACHGLAVVIHPDAPVPFVQGVFRPTVVVPSAGRLWPPQRTRAVLEHERAHVRRRDGLWNLAGQLAARLYWPNPLVWGLLRAARLDAERAADDAAVRSGLPARKYVDSLLDMLQESSWGGVGVLGPAAAAMARPTEIESRVRSLLDPDRKKAVGGPRRIAAWTVGALVATATVSAAARPAPGEVAPWLEVSEDARTVRVLEGARVRFAGTGSLSFTGGRRTIELGVDGAVLRADGAPLPPGGWDGGPVDLRHPDGRWHLTPVDRIPEGPGSRIHDDGEGDARVDSSDSLTFYLAVDRDGSTMFFHPAG